MVFIAIGRMVDALVFLLVSQTLNERFMTHEMSHVTMAEPTNWAPASSFGRSL